MDYQIEYLNPDTLPKNPVFTNLVTVSGNVKTIYIGGQDAVDTSGAIVGKGDIKAQTEQVFKNLQAALAAGGATLENIVKWSIYVVQGQPIQAGFEVFQRVWGTRPNPPAITVLYVAGAWRTPIFYARWMPSPLCRSRTVSKNPVSGGHAGGSQPLPYRWFFSVSPFNLARR